MKDFAPLHGQLAPFFYLSFISWDINDWKCRKFFAIFLKFSRSSHFILPRYIHKFQALQTKVEKLDSTVRRVQKSFNTLQTGQKSSSDKLGKLCLLITKLLPNTDSE